MPLRYVQQHLTTFRPHQTHPTKFMRVCYLLNIDNFNTFIKLQDTLSSLPEYGFYNVNLVPFEAREEIQEHIKMMQKMNENQFEDQYVEMLDLLEKDIERKLIKDFCMKELRWSEAKTSKLL